MTNTSDVPVLLNDQAVSEFAARFSAWAESLPEADQHLLRIMLQRGPALSGDGDVSAYGMRTSLRALILAALVAANAAAGAGLSAPGRAAAAGPPAPPPPGQVLAAIASQAQAAIFPQTDWVIHAVSGPAIVSVGEQFEYEVNIGNIGQLESHQTLAADVTLPAGMTLVSSRLTGNSPDRRYTCSQSGPVVHCEIMLPPTADDNQIDLHLKVQAPNETGRFPVSAVVNADNAGRESSTTNNSANTTTLVVRRPDIGVTMVQNIPLGQAADTLLAYDFKIANNGDSPAEHLTASFQADGARLIDSFDGFPGHGLSCTLSPDRLRLDCAGGTLEHHSDSVQVKVRVRAASAGTTMNIHVSANADFELQKTTDDNEQQFIVKVI